MTAVDHTHGTSLCTVGRVQGSWSFHSRSSSIGLIFQYFGLKQSSHTSIIQDLSSSKLIGFWGGVNIYWGGGTKSGKCNLTSEIFE